MAWREREAEQWPRPSARGRAPTGSHTVLRGVARLGRLCGKMVRSELPRKPRSEKKEPEKRVPRPGLEDSESNAALDRLPGPWRRKTWPRIPGSSPTSALLAFGVPGGSAGRVAVNPLVFSQASYQGVFEPVFEVVIEADPTIIPKEYMSGFENQPLDHFKLHISEQFPMVKNLIADVRAALLPNDSRLCEENKSVAPRYAYNAYGWPASISPQEVVKSIHHSTGIWCGALSVQQSGWSGMLADCVC